MIGILVIVLMIIVYGFFLLGWIIPLVIGSRNRRQNLPGSETWMRFSAIWGILALVTGTGIGIMLFLAVNMNRGSESPLAKPGHDFSPTSYKGPLGSLKIPFQGKSQISAECGKLGTLRCSSSNGTFTLPSGNIRIISFCTSTTDKKNRKWTASGTWHYSCATNSWDIPASGVNEIKAGPPFKASIKATYSPVTDSIDLVPEYVDAYGNPYKVCSDNREGTAPRFELFDGDNKLIMNGKFEFG
ncbi:MAG: hypothetical protein A2283_23830 [Lentisphaerae bacterium RIFOXYA12_FULL_48_11]|nr:MAG: hypothetical protein A2283_23830 [Lentisphaerae bacterium RIFOXYA12_FULL_48_11]